MITKIIILMVKIPINILLLLFSPKYFNDTLVKVKIMKRKDNQNIHYHVIMDEIDDNYISMSLTTRKTKGKNSTNKNKKLAHSPINNNKTSYMRRQATINNKKSYTNPQDGLMDVNDYEFAKHKSDKAKNNYIKQKKQR